MAIDSDLVAKAESKLRFNVRRGAAKGTREYIESQKDLALEEINQGTFGSIFVVHGPCKSIEALQFALGL